ncbi:ubiquitin-conjugating enzyme/RWD-like protein [Hyaloraphidium curvatum]|nr:ubiquitin-conjugating enzyme/RWD-like protein [Hyaloraphidium curvatum]
MSNLAQRRLQKELRDLTATPPPGVTLEAADDLKMWRVRLDPAAGTVYEGESFCLQFRFSNNYPLDSPEVIFLSNAPYRVPMHPHIYSNGHICLSILYDSWSPALTISSVCLSIQSMLSSCTVKERPRDNDMYVANCRGRSPKQTNWAFHDDSV